MVAYRHTNGIAHDIRLVDDGYVAQAGEFLADRETLPTQQECSDPVAWQAMVDAAATEATRLSGIDSTLKTATVGPVTPKTIAELKAMTWAEYSAWFDLNFTTAASLIALLKRLLLYVIRKV